LQATQQRQGVTTPPASRRFRWKRRRGARTAAARRLIIAWKYSEQCAKLEVEIFVEQFV
jgi:hypothetical protein